MKVFSERLKELRLKKGLTQTELANMLNISQKSYSHWETQKKQSPALKILLS